MDHTHRLPGLLGGGLSWALSSGCATGAASLEPVREESVAQMLSPATEELSHFVLILQETDGQVTHAWRRAEQFDLSAYRRQSRARGTEGEVVFVSMRPRDCHAEYVECVEARRVSAGAGLFVLAPAVLLSDAGLGVEPHALVAIQ